MTSYQILKNSLKENNHDFTINSKHDITVRTIQYGDGETTCDIITDINIIYDPKTETCTVDTDCGSYGNTIPVENVIEMISNMDGMQL